MRSLKLALTDLIYKLDENNKKWIKILAIILTSLVFLLCVASLILLLMERENNMDVQKAYALISATLTPLMVILLLIVWLVILVLFIISLVFVLKNRKDRERLVKGLKEIDRACLIDSLEYFIKKMTIISDYGPHQEEAFGKKYWTQYENQYYSNELMSICKILFARYNELEEKELRRLAICLSSLGLKEEADFLSKVKKK